MSSVPEQNTGPEKAVSQKTILIIEDDGSVGSSLVQIIVEETPYLAFLVTDPEQAIQVFKDFIPDLLILDYHLPHMNGLQLYDYLQTQPAFKQTPTIIISAALPRDEVQQRKLFALNKPFDIDDFLTAIHSLLESSATEHNPNI